MLLQAGLLVRVMNSRSEAAIKSFTAVAIYIKAEFTAERYVVYQPDRKSDMGSYFLIADLSSS